VKFGTDINNKHRHLQNTKEILFVSQNCKHGDGPMLLSYIRHIQLMQNQYLNNYVPIKIKKKRKITTAIHLRDWKFMMQENRLHVVHSELPARSETISRALRHLPDDSRSS
jgi:hypothetical protein